MPIDHIARRSVTFFVLTSIPNFACAALLGPLLLAGVFSGTAPAGPTIALTALAWVTSAIVAALPLAVRRIDRDKPRRPLARRLTAGAFALAGGIEDTGRLIAAGRWRAILGACGYLAFDIVALVLGFAAFGVTPPLGPVVFAYVVGQLGGLIPLPGGIGGTDGGLIGALVLYGSPVSQAAVAVLAYRALQLGVPAILGTVAFVRLRGALTHRERGARACAELAEPLAPDPPVTR